MRETSTVVLPLPGTASSSTGPESAWTAASCWGSKFKQYWVLN